MPTAIVPISNSPVTSENGQISTLHELQSQVKTRNTRNNANHNFSSKENLSNNRKSSLQRPQSIDIEDEFNDKIRSARLAALQNNSEDENFKNFKDSNFNTKTNEGIKSKMAPIFSPSRKLLLDSNGKQPQLPKSQTPSPSKIPIANDYFDMNATKNSKRSNVSPPRKIAPSPQSVMESENNSSHDLILNTVENQNTHHSHRNGSEHRLRSNSHSSKGEINDFLSEAAIKLHDQVNGSTAEQTISNKTVVPTSTEIGSSKIPLPKTANNRSRSASQSPSKYGTVSTSPVTSDSTVRGRSEIKLRSSENIISNNSKHSPTSPGLPTHGWCLQTERQEQRSAERARHHLQETTAFQGSICLIANPVPLPKILMVTNSDDCDIS